MKTLITAVAIIMASLISQIALAAEKSVTLAVEGMTCASCPYIVEQTLASVSGVNDVEVSFPEKTATVTFDDSKTNVAALTDATANMGYPSRLIE